MRLFTVASERLSLARIAHPVRVGNDNFEQHTTSTMLIQMFHETDVWI
jgi:hypothetical protein